MSRASNGAREKEDSVKEPLALSETIGSAVGSPAPHPAPDRTAPKLTTITFSISGPGFADAEEFEICDLRTARANARKLMASAIRLFGKTDGPESE
jgi:hypothetical protein